MGTALCTSACVSMLITMVVACGPPPRPAQPEDYVPESMQGHFMTTDGSHWHLYVHDASFAVADTAIEYDSHLAITSSQLEGDRYVARAGQTVGPHSTLFGGVEHRIDATCTGTGTFENDTWTLAFDGDLSCRSYNGTFTRFEQPAERPRRTPRGEASHDGQLHLLVPPDETPFAHAIQGAETVTPGEAPCPVALRTPSADVASGDDPGQAAIRHQGEDEGAEFEVIHVDSGVELPTQPESRQRYQAIYVRVEHSEPSVEWTAGTFEAGTSRGRAFLVDTQEGRIVCVGDVAAQNGDAIQGSSEASARMWLTLQLEIAEERAIALGLRAPAEAAPAP